MIFVARVPSGMSTVTTVELHASPDYDDDAPLTLPALVSDGQVQVMPTTPLLGRFWPVLAGVGSDPGATAVRVPVLTPLDLPYDASLVVSPEEVAGPNFPLPLSADVRTVLVQSIREAQADVVAFLGQGIVPREYVEPRTLAWTEGWDLRAHGDEPLVRIVSVTPVVEDGVITDYFTVRYLAGLDAKTDPDLEPIRRYVALHALNSQRVVDKWKAVVKPEGEVKSLSAEGQSVSFTTPTLGGGGEAGSGKPGALPTMGSLDRWRVAGRRVHQGATRAGEWPYSGGRW